MEWDRSQLEATWRLKLPKGVDLRLVGYHHWQSRSWRKLTSFRGGPALGDVMAHPDAGQAAVYSAILRGEADSSGDDQTLLVGTNQRTYHSYGAQILGHWRVSKGDVASNLEVGLRIHGDQIRRLHTQDGYAMTRGVLVPEEADTEVTTENLGRALALAFHVHEEVRLGPVRILPGVRVEVVQTAFEDAADPESDSSSTRATALPGIGLYAQPTPWLSVFGGVHRGFSPVAPGQPAEVKPESSWNFELGSRISWRSTNIELVGFFNDYSNLTGTCTFSSGCDEALVDRQHDGGAVHVYGVEAVYDQSIRLPEGMELRPGISYTWTGSRFRTTFDSSSPQFGSVKEGDRLPYVPPHQGSVRLLFVHPVGDVELSLAAQAAMRDVPGQGEIDAGELVPGHAVLDLSASLRVTRHASVYLTINNLTNARYIVSRRPLGVRPGRPFHLMVGFKLAFAPRGEGIVERLRDTKLRPASVSPRSAR
jgi:Fe(3+) dicitrate transport protein